MIDLDPVDRITADALGPPGQRVFYIQARSGDRLVTLLVEKQQVQLLAASVVEILSRIGKETGQGPPDEAMELEEPVFPEWRAGRLSIGYEEERDLLLLEAEELLPDEVEESADADEDDPEEDGETQGLEDGPDSTRVEDDVSSDEEAVLEELAEIAEGARQPQRVRFWATREQMLSMARHGAAVCARGRPRCQLCGNPLDPEGHQCPALNGHAQMGDR